MSLSGQSSGLGTIARLPQEIRDVIWKSVLNFNVPIREHNFTKGMGFEEPTEDDEHVPHFNHTSLLRTSHRIYEEAKICMYQTNEFTIAIDMDLQHLNPANVSIMGDPGWSARWCETSMGYTPSLYVQRIMPIRTLKREDLANMQYIYLTLGTVDGITENDIDPTKFQMKEGPERPSYTSLVKTMEDICEMLDRCHSIHVLGVSIRAVEKQPSCIEKLINPIKKLREIGRVIPTVFSMQENCWVDWNLKGSYGRYLSKICSMPRGSVAPKYVGDEKEPNQTEDSIFDMVGARWAGGQIFIHGNLDEDSEGMWDEYDDEFEYVGEDEDFDEGVDDNAYEEEEEEDDEEDKDENETEDDDENDEDVKDENEDEDQEALEQFAKDCRRYFQPDYATDEDEQHDTTNDGPGDDATRLSAGLRETLPSLHSSADTAGQFEEDSGTV